MSDSNILQISEQAKPFEIFKNTATPGDEIKHTFNYRSSAARLNRYRDGFEEQKFIATLKDESHNTFAKVGKLQRDIFIETGLATIIERYSVFGPFHQYPKAFIVGPSQFDQTLIDITGGPRTGKPLVRDVDRIIWVSSIKSNAYYVGCMDLFHEDYVPGSVRYRLRVYTVSQQDVSFDVPDTKTIASQILSKLFNDGDSYSLKSIPGDPPSRKIAFTTDEIEMEITSIVQQMTMNRFHPPEPMEESAPKTRMAMLFSILIGHMGFVQPTIDIEQRLHPVPLGLINSEKLERVLNEIVLKKGATKKLSAPIIHSQYSGTSSEDEMPFNGSFLSNGWNMVDVSDDDLFDSI